MAKEIVAMICGETKPCHTNRGQPVKEQVIDWDFFNKIEQVRGEYAAREGFIRLNNLQVEEDGEKLGEKHEENKRAKEVKEKVGNPLNLNLQISLNSLNPTQKQLLKDLIDSM